MLAASDRCYSEIVALRVQAGATAASVQAEVISKADFFLKSKTLRWQTNTILGKLAADAKTIDANARPTDLGRLKVIQARAHLEQQDAKTPPRRRIVA